MQVADRTDHITHAVLGGQQAMSFGISDDPAFFQILSSSLYKDPILAMVRETLCNGWDAHIDAGITNVPLQVTIDSSYLTIRDFGKGIPADMIAPIYGVYGASTKKNDGRQTGGFGLGCKSPFAYTDHFEVTSMHGGKKTIYRMSKSSAERMGKPSIVPIVSFATTETGITVKIPLKDRDVGKITELAKKVIFNGDILAELNGQSVPVLGLNDAPAGFVLINRNYPAPVDTFENGTLFIRYGNVIYPVEPHEKINSSAHIATNFLNKFFQCDLVMLAPADSLSITPSRESLNMSDMTVETIKNLLSKFLGHVMKSREIEHRHEEIVLKAMEEHAKADVGLAAKLDSLDRSVLPGVSSIEGKLLLSTVDDFAIMQTLIRYTDRSSEIEKKKWGKLMRHYFNQLIAEGLVERSKVQTWMRVYKIYMKDRRHDSRRSYDSKSKTQCALGKWFYRQVTKPVLKKLRATVPGFKDTDLKLYQNMNYYTEKRVRGALELSVTDLVGSLGGFLQPTLVIAHYSNNLPPRMNEMRNTLKLNGMAALRNYFILEVGRSKEDNEKTDQLIQQLDGIEVIDMRPRTPSEERAYQDRLAVQAAIRAARIAMGKPPKPVRKKGDGMVMLKELVDPDIHTRIDTRRFANLEDPERVAVPAAVAIISTAEDARRYIKSMDPDLTMLLVKLWGSEIGVTNNTPVYNKKLKEGIMSIDAFIQAKVKDEFATSPTIREYMRFDSNKFGRFMQTICGSYGNANFATELYDFIVSCPDTQHLIPGFTPLSEVDMLWLALWKELKESYHFSRCNEVIELKKEFDAIELADEAKDLAKKLQNSPFSGAIDVGTLAKNLAAKRKDPVKAAQIVSLIQTML